MPTLPEVYVCVFVVAVSMHACVVVVLIRSVHVLVLLGRVFHCDCVSL